MKKIIILLIAVCVFQTQKTVAQTTQRYGAGAEIAAIGGSGFAYGGTIEYKYLTSKDNFIKNNVIGGNILIGGTLTDGVHLLIGGGYEQNITYERGQPYAMVKFNTPVLVVSGKLLLSQYKQYKNNYEVAVIIFPGQNIVGIGAFYQTDYDCSIIGGKLTFRFGKTNGGSSKKRDDCSICGL